MKVITIADISAWLALEATNVRGLSFRAIVVPGILITSTGELSTPDHLEYLRKVNIGAKDIWVLDGAHPIEALLNEHCHKTLGRIVELISREGYFIEFFETGKHDGEQRVVEELALLLGISPDEVWKKHVRGNHPSLAYLGSKTQQRQLALSVSAKGLFSPHELIHTSEELESAVTLFSQCEQVMVRLDGEASSEGQCVYPDKSLSEIWELIGSEKCSIIVEPYYPDHIAAGALLEIRDEDIIFLGISDQLMIKDPRDGKPLSYGNLLFTVPEIGSAITAEVFSRVKIKSLLMGKLLQDQGIRGCISVDLLILPSGTVYVTETNIRLTNGWYGYWALVQLQEAHQMRVFTGLNIFKPMRPEITDFSSLFEDLDDYIYDGTSPYGVIPVVTTVLPGQCHLQLVARTLEEYEDLMHKVWRRLECAGDPPIVVHDRKSIPRTVVPV